MNNKKSRRNPLDKEQFGEGNRQKWAGIFTVIGLGIMILTSYGFIKDPAPFLQFFLSIGVTFILGASATAVMNSWKVNSSTQTENANIKEEVNINEVKTENINSNKTEKIEYTEKIVRPRDFAGEEID